MPDLSNNQRIVILGSIAAAGVFGTQYFARKAVVYRKQWRTNAVAANTLTHLLFEAKDLIEDPEKSAAFQKEMEYQIELTANFQKLL